MSSERRRILEEEPRERDLGINRRTGGRKVVGPSVAAVSGALHVAGPLPAEQQTGVHPVPGTQGVRTLGRNEVLGKIPFIQLMNGGHRWPVREHLLAWGSYLNR